MMQEYISKTWLLQNTNTGMDVIKLLQTIADAPVVEFDTAEHDKLERRAKWHSCGERLPECGEAVLTYSKYGHIHDRIFDGTLFRPDGLKPGKDITHWRYMPHLPKEVDGDD